MQIFFASIQRRLNAVRHLCLRLTTASRRMPSARPNGVAARPPLPRGRPVAWPADNDNLGAVAVRFAAQGVPLIGHYRQAKWFVGTSAVMAKAAATHR